METGPAPAGGTKRRLLIIVNPAAGRAASSRRRLRRVVALLERRGCTVVVRATTGTGSAERLARAAGSDFDIVVAAGGDGTINEVANGLAAAALPGGDAPALAVLPFGSANVLAREVGLPFRARPLARLLATAGARPIWPGLVGGRLFLMMVGSGFDAAIVAGVDPALKRRLGRLAVLAAIPRAFRRYRASEIVLDIDGTEHRAVAAIITKGRCYAGGFVLAPRAALGERAFEIVLFRRAGRLAVLRAVVALPLGLVHRLPEVATLRAMRVGLAGSGLVQIDGEAAGRLPVAITLCERPILLLQPEASVQIRSPRRV